MRRDTKDKYVVGDTVLLTTGSYSDYSIVGLFKVVKEFDIDQMMKDWRDSGDQTKIEEGWYKGKPKWFNDWDGQAKFWANLTTSGFLEEIDYREIWQDFLAYPHR
jgi:hypothetical protein